MTENDETELIIDPEINALLTNLKPDGNVKILRSLCGSRKNPNQSTVLKICSFDDSQNPWADEVIKTGDCATLKKEFNNYLEYVEGPLPAEFKVVLHEPICKNDKAIMQIDFVNSEKYQMLTDYYKENPVAALETLLNSALKPWHEKIKDDYFELKKYILTRLKSKKIKIFDSVNVYFQNLIVILNAWFKC